MPSDRTTRNEKRAHQIHARINELEERIVQLRAQEELDALRAPIDGNDVMRYLGVSPGPVVGTVMKMLVEHRIERGPYHPEEAYELIREWAIDEGMDDPGASAG